MCMKRPDSNLHPVCAGVARPHSRAEKARAAAADCYGTSCLQAQIASLATVGRSDSLQKVCQAQAGQRFMNPALCHACLLVLVVCLALRGLSSACSLPLCDMCVAFSGDATYSLTHSLTNPPTHSLTHSPTHSLTHTHSLTLTHLLTHPLTRTQPHPSTVFLVLPVVQPSFNTLIHAAPQLSLQWFSCLRRFCLAK